MIALLLSLLSAQADFVPIFDGRTLTGWRAPDMSHFGVEDGAITGTVTEGKRPPRNVFLVWEGKVADFELTFEFRMQGERANSGMQFRSEVREHGLVHGYQADIAPLVKGQPAFLGGIWDEYGARRSLAGPGERVHIDERGRRKVTRFAEGAAVLAGVDVTKWTRYHIVARGPKVVLRINGRVTAELEDHESGKALREGVLAVPVIPQAMKVQYRKIRLKRL